MIAALKNRLQLKQLFAKRGATDSKKTAAAGATGKVATAKAAAPAISDEQKKAASLKWRYWKRRYESMPERQRVLMFLASLAGTYFVINTVFVGPSFSKQATLTKEIARRVEDYASAQTDLTTKQAELAKLIQDKTNLEAELVKRRAAAKDRLEKENQGYIPAQAMVEVVRGLVQSPTCNPAFTACLQVKSLRSIPAIDAAPNLPVAVEVAAVAPAAAPPAAGPNSPPGAPNAPAGAPAGAPPGAAAPSGGPPAAGAASPAVAIANAAAAATAAANAKSKASGLWRQGIEITVEGSYGELYDYLLRLEALPHRIFKAGMSFEVTKHPIGTLTLTLYTLSLDKSLLEL